MLRFLTIAALSVASWSTAAYAQTSETAIADTASQTIETASREWYGVGDVPNVRLADKRRHVSDPNGLLSVAARDTIDTLLSALEDSTGHQVAIAMLPSIGDADPFDFSQALFEKWGVGRKGVDDGLLIVYIADQGTIRFHTGYGLEGIMPDSRSRRIQAQSMAPHFKEGDTDGGMVDGINAVCKTLSQTSRPDATNHSDNSTIKDSDDTPSAWWLLLLAPVAGGIWLANWITIKRRRCPHCGERGHVRKKSSDTFEENEKKYWRETYVCALCGHEYTKTGIIPTATQDNTDNISKPPNSGFFGGNQNIGSPWGGGHSGGGGAQTKW